jgi:hypothetical protein
MKYKKDYFGYVYQWTDSSNGKKYIGSHYGSVDDYYKGSGKDFVVAYTDNPQNFTMEVLEYISTNDKKLVLEVEQTWLDSIPNIKDHPGFYNLNNNAVGGFGYITKDHISERAETLRKKHSEFGLSHAEKDSYKQKIKTRLDRIAASGFTAKEKEQYSKYGYQISVTMPSGETKIYSSCGQASRELGIDVQYGLKVCSKKFDFRGYKIVKLRDPITDCR